MIFSGKHAFVAGVPLTASWTATEATTHQRHSDSGVAGATRVPDGVANWTGTITGFGAQPPLFPSGTNISFQGVRDNTSGHLRSMVGTILVESLTIDINLATQADISWTVAFGCQGALTSSNTGATPTAVHGNTDVENGKDLMVKVAGNVVGHGTDSEIQSAQLSFKRPAATYVTHGGLTSREPGNLEADISIAVLNDDMFASEWATNSVSGVEVFVTATTSWLFNAIKFGGKTNCQFSRNPRTLIGYTVPGMWTPTTAAFQITGPDLTTYYTAS